MRNQGEFRRPFVLSRPPAQVVDATLRQGPPWLALWAP